MSRPKFFRDPVHMQIRFESVDLKAPLIGLSSDQRLSSVLQRLIDTEFFQRLRLVRQNGLANLVFHGAEHSRFAHSMGVQHVAQLMYERICRNRSIAQDPDIKLEIAVASLLHDIGHGAFSHTLEEILKEAKVDFHHEDMTKSFLIEDGPIRNILDEVNSEFKNVVASYFDKKLRREDNWKFKVVSSQMDADRLDYVQRDALFAGMKGHGFDFERIVDLLDVHDDKSIAVNRGAIEAYLVTIDQLYRAIYYHQGVRSATQMLLSLFKRAMDLYSLGDGSVFPAIGGGPHPILMLVTEGSKISLQQYSRISDATVWGLIDYWRFCADPVLSDLSRRLLERRLLKAMTIKDMNFSKITALKEKAIELSRAVVGEECAAYYVAVDDPSRTSYKGYDFNPDSADESIWLTGGGERDQPLEDSDSVLVRALRSKNYFSRLIVLDEVREQLIRG